jgi:hypothetical protein
MNEFTEHIKILIFALFALLVTFILAFSMEVQRIWFPCLLAIITILAVIAILARSSSEIQQTD